MVRGKWGGRLRKALLVAFVTLFVLSPVFKLTPVSADATSHLYWTDAELAAFKARTDEPVYQNIKAWGDTHKNDAPPAYPASPLTSDAAAGQPIVVVADGSMFSVGSLYFLQQEPKTSEYVRLESKASNTLTMYSNLTTSYTTVEGARLSCEWRDWMDTADLTRRFLETMSLLYYVTDDTSYADAAVNWMVSIAGWPNWNIALHRQWQVTSWMGMAFACGYDAFKDYMSADNAAIVRDKIKTEIGHMYNDYTSLKESLLTSDANSGQKTVTVANGSVFYEGQYVLLYESGYSEYNFIESIAGNTLTMENNLVNSYQVADGAKVTTNDGWITSPMTEPYPNSRAVLACAIGMSGLALGSDYAGSSTWISRGKALAVETFDMLYDDGTWFEGMGYAVYGLDGLVTFCDVLKRVEGTDYFTIYSAKLSGMSEFFAFMTYNGQRLQMEDCSWTTPIGDGMTTKTSFLYRIAKEYSNGYGQQYANTYTPQDIMQSFVWRDPALSPVALSGLGDFRYFDGIGYSIYRSDWTNAALLIINKAGTSRGHAHNSSGEFQIYYKGKPVTCDYGYATGEWYDESWTKNTIVEGPEFTEGGYNVPGYGEGQEPGDLGNVPEGYHGVIETATSNAYYTYSRANNTPAGSNPFTNDHSSSVKKFWTGNLSLWIRQTAFLPGTNALVVFDRVASPEDTRFSWLYHATNAAVWEVITITVDGDIVTVVKNGGGITPADITSKIVMVEPVEANRTTEVKAEDPGHAKDWKYLVEYPATDSDSALFLNVIFPDSDDYDATTTARVAQNNCSGVIITTTANGNKDLVLFSNDGNAVSEYIELGGFYQAADGNTYTFDGTQVLAEFDTYQVMKLALSGTNQPPVLDAIGDKTVNEEELLEFTISATDTNGDPLTYSASNLPSGASFDTGTQTFSWTPSSGQEGTYPNVHFEVTDGDLTDAEDITITVSNVNQIRESNLPLYVIPVIITGAVGAGLLYLYFLKRRRRKLKI